MPHLLANRLPRLWGETGRQVVRFGFVGIAATAVHSLVALTVMVRLDGTALVANLLGFAIAFSVSLWGNLLWVFPQSRRSEGVVGRFLALSLLTLGATSSISWAFDRLGYEAILSLPVVLVVGPTVSYLGNRFWVFSE